MRKIASKLTLLAVAATLFGTAMQRAEAAPKKEFKVAWSIYVGWMPLGWANDNGIVKKWADKYGITIDVVQFNDYDAVILENKSALAGIKGQKVNLVEFSVSHYLLARALESAKLTGRDVTVVNTSDADMVAAYKTPSVGAVVTWHPLVSEIMGSPDAKSVFDSSRIPGEIIDLMVANTAVLQDSPALGKALAGIWYETTEIMTAHTEAGQAARAAMGKASGADLASFDHQLEATRLFATAPDAVAFTASPEVGTTMDRLRHFLFEKNLLGTGVTSVDAGDIELADGRHLGDAKNVKLRFTDTFMAAAAGNKL